MSEEHSQNEQKEELEKTIAKLRMCNAELSNTVAQKQEEIDELRDEIRNMETSATVAANLGVQSTSIIPAARGPSPCGSVDIFLNYMGSPSDDGSQKKRVMELGEAVSVLQVSNAELLEKMTQVQKTVDELRTFIDELRTCEDELKTSNIKLTASNVELTRRISDVEMSDGHIKKILAEDLRKFADHLIKASSTSPFVSPKISPANTRIAVPTSLLTSVHSPLFTVNAASPTFCDKKTTCPSSSNMTATASEAILSSHASTSPTAALSTVSYKVTDPSSANMTDSITATTLSSHTTTSGSSPLITLPATTSEHGESLSRGLWDAAYDGDVQRIRELVAEGANFEYRDKNDFTAVHAAAGRGHVDALKALIELNAPYETEGTFKTTPLLMAALLLRDDCVKELLSAGVDVNIRNSYGMTALHYAVREESLSMVEMLIAAGADQGVKDKEGKMPKDLTTNDDILALL